MGLGFAKSLNEFTLYLSKIGDEILVVSLYVDDFHVTRSSMEKIDTFKRKMKDAFEMTDLGKMTFFLGMKFQQKKNDILIFQHRYA